MFANFDLELGVVGTMHQFVDATITPAANGWFRYAMTIASTEGHGFVIGLVTAAYVIKGQTNTLATSILLAFPQMEAGQVATSYIPTNGSPVTRAADIITYDVAMSLFRLYGVRDFVGPMVSRGLLGASGPPGESIVGLQGERGQPGESIVGPQGERKPPGESIVGPPGSDANVPLWVDATQSNVQLSAFGGTLAASRVTDIDYNSLINKTDVILPGYLPPIAHTADTQELSGRPCGNGIYAYTSSVSPDSGFELFRLSGFAQEVRFSSSLGIVITLALPISASISKYALCAGQSSIVFIRLDGPLPRRQ